MAYNTFMNGYGNYPYQQTGINYGYQQPNYMQQYRPMIQKPIQSPFQNILFLNEKEIDARVVDAGTSDLLIDMDKGIACVKSADNLGQSSQTKYRVTKIDPQEVVNVEEKQPVINTDDFIKKDYFDSFTKKLYEKIGEIETKLTIKEIKGEE